MSPQFPPIAVWDSGLRSGAWNAACDRRGLARLAAGAAPGVLRFYRSRPTASVGRHQALDRELRLDYCRSKEIGVVRRVSGGGALYQDERQLGLSLLLAPPPEWKARPAAQLLEQFCAGLIAGLAQLGIASRYKFPNDIEIGGRKIASVFLATANGALLFQAGVLLDVDVKTMLEALRVPTEKLSASGLDSARDRLITLSQCLGSPPLGNVRRALQAGLAAALGVRFRARRPEALPDFLAPEQPERDFAAAIDWSAIPGEWLEALRKTAGGVLRARIRVEPRTQTLQRVEFAADAHLFPADLLERLQQALCGASLAQAPQQAAQFLRQCPAELVGFSADDVAETLRLALDKLSVLRDMGLTTAQANALMVYSAGGRASVAGILDNAGVMLVPYCAKPAWCQWRNLDDCTECGRCEVGEAYRLGRERGMEVVSITHYEHLVTTLARMKAQGTAAYVGMCCSHFFVKRYHAFEQAGMPMVLLDIGGANCYELKQEAAAYAGRFQAQSQLDTDLLRQVMRFVPPVRRPPETRPENESL